jgi:alkylation response protein AidB-like acyl-CoA dehydrogenase
MEHDGSSTCTVSFDNYRLPHANLIDRGIDDLGMEASVANLRATDLGMRVATEFVQLHAGYVYYRDYPLNAWRGTPISRKFGKARTRFTAGSSTQFPDEMIRAIFGRKRSELREDACIFLTIAARRNSKRAKKNPSRERVLQP